MDGQLCRREKYALVAAIVVSISLRKRGFMALFLSFGGLEGY
jgi:hypothetical protein